MGAEKVIGNKIDDRMYNKVLKLTSRGDTITFFDIKTEVIKVELSGPMRDPAFPILIEIY